MYIDCAERGELIVCGGAVSNVLLLLQAALDQFGSPPVALASDRWREGELRDALKAAGVPLAALELRGQGFRDGGEDVRDFHRAFAEGRVVPVRSLLLASAMAEARCAVDPAGKARQGQGGRATNAGAGRRGCCCNSRRWRWARGGKLRPGDQCAMRWRDTSGIKSGTI